MFKLVTGSPGDGKTSNELWLFLHADEYKGRPKFSTPIKGFEPEKHGVIAIDHIKDWRDLPDGAVIFCDEVQDYLGARSSREPPEWIQDLAKHRHRGMDFICTTQSPMFLDQFARKLVKPHVHYSRPWNMKGCRYTWDALQNDPTTKSAKKLGQRELVTPNPKVFELYTSTVLDTHKPRPPWKVIAVGVAALLFLVGGISLALYNLSHMNEEVPTDGVQVNPEPAEGSYSPVNVDPTATTGWSADSVKPRIEGLAWTAPVYDRLTAPTDFPRTAACMYSQRTGCNCYTQQGTPLSVPKKACLVYVSEGSFDPWLSSRRGDRPEDSSPGTTASAGTVDVPRHEERNDSSAPRSSDSLSSADPAAPVSVGVLAGRF